MKIGNIVESNSKGQIVIPKMIRDSLGITEGKYLNVIQRGGGIYIYPVESINTTIESENTLLQVLEASLGIWKDEKDCEERLQQSYRNEAQRVKERKMSWS